MATPEETTIVRELAKQVADVADRPIQAERRERWKKHNSLQSKEPMILLFPEGSWREMLPDSVCQCEDKRLRGIEWNLRMRLYYHEHFCDDTVIEKEWSVSKAIHNSGWGLSAKHHDSTEARGAWKFDPVIREPSDLQKLKHPKISVDEAASAESLAFHQDLFGDILDVKQKGVTHISFHLMNLYTGLRGLEEVMMDMYEEPEMLHDAMAFLEEGFRGMMKQYEDLNLLTLNNDNTYHNSGGNGWTDELPADGFDPARVRLCDMWGSAEAQEMAQVSPEMHDEFILQYEKRLLEPFGLTGYGCCEDLTRKMDLALTIPHIRRVSMSPWADVEKCAEQVGDKVIFSWKPDPAMLVGTFDERRVRDYIAHALDATEGCVFEMILKDTHTCENHPERFDRWCAIARELADEKIAASAR